MDPVHLLQKEQMQGFKKYNMKRILIYICLISQVGCKAQSKPCLNSNATKDFIIELYNKDNLVSKGLLLDSILDIKDYIYIDSSNCGINTNVFTKEDLDFIKCQVTKSNNKVWNDIIDKKAIILSSKVLEDELFNKSWDNFRASYGSGFYCYSLPLFSNNKNDVFIVKKYICGPTCGYSRKIIYHKENNTWKELQVLSNGHK